MILKFTVFGKPEPQGSIRSFQPKGCKFPVLTSDNKNLKPYRQEVSLTALAEMRKEGLEPIQRKNEVRLQLKFYFQRPKSKSKNSLMVVKPDLDKLKRAVSDALSKGICYHDDSQITWSECTKDYGEPERTEIEVLG